MRNKAKAFHDGNRKTEETLQRLNDQKRRTFAFNKNERDNQIEKDNMNLLVKLEEIKNKGTNLAKKRNTKSLHQAFVDPNRVKNEHSKYQQMKTAAISKKLDYQNVKLAYHLTKAPASISL